MKAILIIGFLLTAAASSMDASMAVLRSEPVPRTNHPGNVFITGEEVVLRLPQGDAKTWRVLDYDGNEVTSLQTKDEVAVLGRLPVGFYSLKGAGQSNWISCAVLPRLESPTPLTSPVALDVAMAWFYPQEKMADVASLCALAGVNRVRDRLTWRDLEPQRGQWSDNTRYDDSARLQSEAGLQVLQVIHMSPPWANPATKRFPLDLRHAYEFFRQVARRWQEEVQSFEPWNEADIEMFGGHTGSEMAAMQKASYLGLKAGNQSVTACLNVFALHNRAQLADLDENEAGSYFDTFNLHHYAPFEDYPKVYGDFRAVSGGKPLWVSECALPVRWTGDESLKEPSDGDLRVQAERVAKTFARSLHEGSTATFYFMLPHYVEGQTQFGLLRPDLTPRPGYAALAAVGRLLADAKPLGQLRGVTDVVQGFLFHAKPDGQSRNVLVTWTTVERAGLSMPIVPLAVFDHLGRNRPATDHLELTPAPVFAILPDNSAGQFSLQLAPKPPERLHGKPSPVVIQALWPESTIVLKESAYRISSQKAESVPLFVYNFSDSAVKGQLDVALPKGWKAGALGDVEVAPQSRTELRLDLDCRGGASKASETVRITGDFGKAGNPVLSMRVMPEPSLLTRQAGSALVGAGEAEGWLPTISGGGSLALGNKDGAVVVDAEPLGSDKWVYPLLKVAAPQRPPQGTTGLCCTLVLQEGEGQFRGIFDEENGSSYVVDFLTQPKRGEPVEAAMLFEHAVYGVGWSKLDANGRLDPDQIVSLKIGCNTKAGKVKFAVKNLRWVK